MILSPEKKFNNINNQPNFKPLKIRLKSQQGQAVGSTINIKRGRGNALFAPPPPLDTPLLMIS